MVCVAWEVTLDDQKRVPPGLGIYVSPDRLLLYCTWFLAHQNGISTRESSHVEVFWIVHVDDVAKAVQHNADFFLMLGLLVGCGCFTLTCTFFLENRDESFPHSSWNRTL